MASADFAAERLFQLALAHLDHGGAAVRAAVREVAGEEVLDEADEFGFAEEIVGLDGVAADGLGDHVFAEAQFAGLCAGFAEVVDDLAQELGGLAAAEERGEAIDLEGPRAEGL